MDVAVIGGTGSVGRLVLAELARRGHVGRPVGTDVPAVERSLAEHHPDAAIATAPAEDVVRAVLPAAVAARVPVVDASPEQSHLERVHAGWADRASEAGVTIVPGAGAAFLLGDLLGAVAARATRDPAEVHVAYALPDRGDLLRGWTGGLRRSAIAGLAAGGVALVDGAQVEENAGEARRLAWFPRPVGPHHAAGMPGGEALSLPRHVDGLRTVRTYVALPSLAAELLQAGARSLRRGGGEGRVAQLLLRLPAPDDRRRGAIRWACVAEAAGRDGPARAWAYGADPYAFAAAALVLVAEHVAGGSCPCGVVAPGELGDPAALLDELTLRTGARWSLARPDR